MQDRRENARIMFPSLKEIGEAGEVSVTSRGMIWTLDGNGEWTRHLMEGGFRPLHIWTSDPAVVEIVQFRIGLLDYLVHSIPARYLSPLSGPGSALGLSLIRPYDNVTIDLKSHARLSSLTVEIWGILHTRS